MITTIKKLLGIESPVNYINLINEGAVILDVRSKGEYNSGHIKGSINIPVDALQNNLGKFKDKNKPVITCCASGIRSASAKSILKANGFLKVYNGGSWMGLRNKIQ
ncbi:rhodanese-like domain-containing protein [soil metagenome]